ncbi:MAG: glucose-1-phosphate adenylyltransferase subunit GlgD [Bacilli bacterium]|nr:glucose-1-phosphate adenylyltransferase subunit GlgD [Bacilli bacterium]
MNILGLIFSNIHNKELFEVTKRRTIASTPIGGRYRLIDFALSNMVNYNISHIGIVTKHNYQSLMDHIGSGKDWDLARKHGGIVILPPFGVSTDFYNTRLEALKSIISFINNSRADYVVLTDCYEVANLDYREIFNQHFTTEADITFVYRECDVSGDDYMPVNVLTLNEAGRITNMSIYQSFTGRAKVSADTWVMKKTLLQSLVLDAINRNLRSFNRDILSHNLDVLKIYGYRFDGFFGNVSSLDSYYKINMALLDDKVRVELFQQPNRPIYTKVRDSAPTKYGNYARISNSLIADGCEINGSVENSVVFRGTKIGKNTIVKNSILMQNTIVADEIILDHVITDKNVKIINMREIIGDDHRLAYIVKDGVV